MSDVTQLGVTKEQIARIIQQIVKDSSSVFFTNESSLHEKDLVINRLQIFSCLKKGKVMTEPVKTNEGFVECGWNCMFPIPANLSIPDGGGMGGPDGYLFPLQVPQLNGVVTSR